jgi:hypothetical protein
VSSFDTTICARGFTIILLTISGVRTGFANNLQQRGGEHKEKDFVNIEHKF